MNPTGRHGLGVGFQGLEVGEEDDDADGEEELPDDGAWALPAAVGRGMVSSCCRSARPVAKKQHA